MRKVIVQTEPEQRRRKLTRKQEIALLSERLGRKWEARDKANAEKELIRRGICDKDGNLINSHL